MFLEHPLPDHKIVTGFEPRVDFLLQVSRPRIDFLFFLDSMKLCVMGLRHSVASFYIHPILV